MTSPALPEPVFQSLLSWALGYLDGGAFREAERLLADLADLRPDAPEPRAAAAVASIMLSENQKALDHLMELLARFPSNPLAHKVGRMVNRTGGSRIQDPR